MTPITNRIITRGLGMSRGAAGRAGLITQGYGGPPSFVVTTLENVARRPHGRSGRRDQEDLQLVILWAKMVELNGKAPPRKIEGSVKVSLDKSKIAVLVERVSTGVRQLWNDIKVSAKRIK